MIFANEKVEIMNETVMNPIRMAPRSRRVRNPKENRHEHHPHRFDIGAPVAVCHLGGVLGGLMIFAYRSCFLAERRIRAEATP